MVYGEGDAEVHAPGRCALHVATVRLRAGGQVARYLFRYAVLHSERLALRYDGLRDAGRLPSASRSGDSLSLQSFRLAAGTDNGSTATADVAAPHGLATVRQLPADTSADLLPALPDKDHLEATPHRRVAEKLCKHYDTRVETPRPDPEDVRRLS